VKLKYYSPFQDRVDVIDFGFQVSRGEVIDVSDEVAKVLLKHPHFARVVDKPDAKPEAHAEPPAEKQEPAPPPNPPPANT
jgi:hypothetical protein